MQNLEYVKSLIELYKDPGIEISYNDIDDGSKVVLLNDDNGWQSSLLDGSSVSISVTYNGNPVSIDSSDSSTWIDMSKVGEHIISYTFTNDTGVSSTATRNVSIYDSEVPEITLLGDNPYDLPIGGTYMEQGYVIDDEDIDELKKSNISIVGATGINTAVSGTYEVIYNYTDSSGLTASPISRIVNVFNNTGPVITLNGPVNVEISLGTSYIEYGASGIDALGNDLSSQIKIISNVDTAVPGTYTVKYVVTDSYGESYSINRIITVTEYPELDDVIVSDKKSDKGTGLYVRGAGRNALFSKDLSITNFTEVNDVDNIIQNIYNIIFQSPRERIFNPLFGSRIGLKTFDLMDINTESEILSMLKSDIEKYERRATVVINRSSVTIDANNNILYIVLKVTVPTSTELQQVAFSLRQ